MFGPSTAYRDYRTSAFQQFAVASEHCLGLVPEHSSFEQCAAIGEQSSEKAQKLHRADPPTLQVSPLSLPPSPSARRWESPCEASLPGV